MFFIHCYMAFFMEKLAKEKATELIFKYGLTEAKYLCDIRFWELVKKEVLKAQQKGNQ